MESLRRFEEYVGTFQVLQCMDTPVNESVVKTVVVARADLRNQEFYPRPRNSREVEGGWRSSGPFEWSIFNCRVGFAPCVAIFQPNRKGPLSDPVFR